MPVSCCGATELHRAISSAGIERQGPHQASLAEMGTTSGPCVQISSMRNGLVWPERRQNGTIEGQLREIRGRGRRRARKGCRSCSRPPEFRSPLRRSGPLARPRRSSAAQARFGPKTATSAFEPGPNKPASSGRSITFSASSARFWRAISSRSAARAARKASAASRRFGAATPGRYCSSRWIKRPRRKASRLVCVMSRAVATAADPVEHIRRRDRQHRICFAAERRGRSQSGQDHGRRRRLAPPTHAPAAGARFRSKQGAEFLPRRSRTLAPSQFPLHLAESGLDHLGPAAGVRLLLPVKPRDIKALLGAGQSHIEKPPVFLHRRLRVPFARGGDRRAIKILPRRPGDGLLARHICARA